MIGQLSEPDTATEESKGTRTKAVPAGWETITLGEACEKPQYGFTASAETRNTGTRFLRITDLREGDLKWNEVPFCSCLESEIDRYQLKTGDLVVARIGATTGRTSLAISPPKAVFASYLIRLRPKADINPFFLYFFTQSSAYWSSINSSKDSNLKGGVNAGVLARIEISKPSKTEQQKIAAVLWNIQKAVEIEDAILRNARDLKKSVLRRLFTHGLRGEPLKETEIGPLPQSWEVIRLGEKADLKNGINFSRAEKGAGTLTVDVLNMYCPSLAVDTTNLYRVSKRISDDYFLQDNDILFVRSSLKQEGVGWASLFRGGKEPVTFCGFLIRCRLKDRQINAAFLANYLRLPSTRETLIAASGKVAITNINQTGIQSLPVPVPQASEQQEIADILQTIDRKIDIHESKKRSLQELFKTMLHKLMTAQIRVNDLDIDTNEVGTGT